MERGHTVRCVSGTFCPAVRRQATGCRFADSRQDVGAPFDRLGWLFGPAGLRSTFTFLSEQQFGGVCFAAGTDEGVSAGELEAEPGDESSFVDGVEPEGDFREIDGGGVEIDAEDVVVGDEHFHLLALLGVVVVRDGDAGFLLLSLEVGFGELVDGFVGKCSGTDGHFANGQAEDFIGQ